MTIGERLTALRPDERRNEYRLKEAINAAATEIAHEYLAEIAPYVSGLKPELLFDRLPGHVISRAELELIGADDDETHDGQEAFTSLYRVGLLRLRAARSRARRVAPALPSPRRGDARDQRRPAAGDELLVPPGARATTPRRGASVEPDSGWLSAGAWST